MTSVVCPPDSVPDQRQHLCFRLRDIQFTVSHFRLSRNRIRLVSLLDQVVLTMAIPGFVRKFANKFTTAVMFFFTQNFSEYLRRCTACQHNVTR